MKNLDILILALEYIEENLETEINVQKVADHCFTSLSALQKTFRYAFHCSIKDYIIRRRLSCAAKALADEGTSVLDAAVRFGYGSSESFSRAFKKFWGISPSEFQKTRRFSQITPKLSVPKTLPIEEGSTQMRTKYDITQLYELIQERKNCCYICADLHHLMQINNTYGREAGDHAIREAFSRLEAVCGDNDILFRTGGDEFVIITDTEELTYADKLVKELLSHNGETISHNTASIEISLWAGAFRDHYEHHVNYDELVRNLYDKIVKIHKES